MNYQANENVVCMVCGDSGPHLPVIKSRYFKETPIICERCFFEKLIGKKFEWTDQMKRFIKGEKP